MRAERLAQQAPGHARRAPGKHHSLSARTAPGALALVGRSPLPLQPLVARFHCVVIPAHGPPPLPLRRSLRQRGRQPGLRLLDVSFELPPAPDSRPVRVPPCSHRRAGRRPGSPPPSLTRPAGVPVVPSVATRIEPAAGREVPPPSPVRPVSPLTRFPPKDPCQLGKGPWEGFPGPLPAVTHPKRSRPALPGATGRGRLRTFRVTGAARVPLVCRSAEETARAGRT